MRAEQTAPRLNGQSTVVLSVDGVRVVAKGHFPEDPAERRMTVDELWVLDDRGVGAQVHEGEVAELLRDHLREVCG